MTHVPQINTYFAGETTSSSSFLPSPTHAPIRSRKTLPFPLPDPYAQDNFELHDPRGFFKKRRASSVSTAGSDTPPVHTSRTERITRSDENPDVSDVVDVVDDDQLKTLNAGISGLSLALQQSSAAPPSVGR